MKSKLLLIFALVVAAGCGPSDQETASGAAPVAAVDTSPAAATEPAAEVIPAPQAARPERIELAQEDGSAADALAAAGFEEGTHYVRLSPTQPTSSSPEQVEVAEFFMYSCIHCYNFEPYVEQWLESKPDYVNFVRVPTVWNAAVRMHAQAFYTAEALGTLEQMHSPFFQSMHVDGNYLQSEDAIAEFFSRFDVSREEFEGAFESFAVHTKLQRADELARRYRVDSTPTVVVNGKYRTNASMAGGYDRLLELANALAASEHTAN